MATNVAVAIRKSEAQERIAKAAEELAHGLRVEGVEVGGLTPTHRDPGIAQAMQLEAIADLLEELCTAPGIAGAGGVKNKGAKKLDNETYTPQIPAATEDAEADLGIATAEATNLAEQLEEAEGDPGDEQPASVPFGASAPAKPSAPAAGKGK